MRLLTAALVALLAAGCAGPKLQNQSMLRGFNVMQHEQMPWNEAKAERSIEELAELGCNAVVVISFLEQDSSASVAIRNSDAVSYDQIRRAITYAHNNGLKVILKPQVLVSNSWAGGIDFASQQQWKRWFENYSREIVTYARLASEHGVHAFVIGTELSAAANKVDWPGLIKQVRRVYRGQLTYAAHNVDGIKAFKYWHQLDAVAVTMYPSLGKSGESSEMQGHIENAVEELRLAVADFNREVWVLEIGMPSASGAAEKPWQWQDLKQAGIDLGLQKRALSIWLSALDQPWVDALFIWAWFSDYTAGGSRDSDYTPQNKPAEAVIRNYWKL